MDTSVLASPILVDAKLGADGALDALNSPVSLLNGMLLVPLASIANVDLRGLNEGGSITIPIKPASEEWTATDEATPVSSDTDYELASITATVAFYDLAASLTDTLRRRDPTGAYSVLQIAQWMVRGAFLTVVSAVAALADSATEEVGANNVPGVWDLIQEAKNRIISRGKDKVGPLMVAVIHVDTWAEITTDLAAADGARANRRNFDASQGVSPQGFQGIYDDILVYTTDRVNDDGTAYSHLVFSPGAIWVHVVPSSAPSASEIRVLDVAGITVEEVRDAETKSVRLIGGMEFGTGIIRDELVCRVLTQIPA